MNKIENKLLDELTNKGKDDRIVILGKHKTFGLILNCISTGAPSIDRIIAKDINGNFGIPCGRTSFVSGKPGSGKTTLCLHLCAETQKAGGIAYFIDGEHRIDKNYAKQIGVNLDKLFYNAPDTLEDILETIDKTINIVKKLKNDDKIGEGVTKIPLLIVVDSVSIATRAEKTGEIGKGGKGGHARIISEFLRKITPEISKLNIAILFVCQIKSKINMGYGTKGTKETFLAEDTLRYHCTIGLRTQRISTIKNDKSIRYADVDLYVTTKNSCLPPFQDAEVELHYGIGFNYYASLTDTLVDYYGAEKAGAWYNHGNIGKWQGKDGIGKLIEKDPKIIDKINEILKSPMTIKIGSTRGKKEEIEEENK